MKCVKYPNYINYLLYTFLLIITLIIVLWSVVIYVRWEMRNKIRKLFIKVIHELEREGIHYWTDFGTLLGIVRDGDIIMGDYDGDICIVPEEENLAKCSQVVRKMGGTYSDKDVFRISDKSWFFIHIDLFIPTLVGEIYHTPCGEQISKHLIHPIQSDKCKLGEEQLIAKLPHRSQDVLTSRYGSNWIIPKRKWWLAYTDIELEMNELKKIYKK